MNRIQNQSAPFRQAVSVNEFCNAWSIGRTHFYALVKAGEIRVIRLGRRTLVPCCQGEEWLQKAIS